MNHLLRVLNLCFIILSIIVILNHYCVWFLDVFWVFILWFRVITIQVDPPEVPCGFLVRVAAVPKIQSWRSHK